MSKKLSTVEVVLLILTLALGSLSYALDDKLSRALFGAALVIDLFTLTRRIQTALENQATHEYLATGPGIWDRAIELVNEANNNCGLIGTTSNLNDPAFERTILNRMATVDFIYTRIMCYPPETQEQTHQFPSIDEIKGNSREERLRSYLDWYAKFYKHSTDDESIPMAAAMSVWHKALGKIRATHFDLKYHKEPLPTDFLILKSEDGHCQAAILAFSRRKGEPMGSGFRTKNPRLAYDFSLNLERLLSS